jgi:hypothetical protein
MAASFLGAWVPARVLGRAGPTPLDDLVRRRGRVNLALWITEFEGPVGQNIAIGTW